MFCTECGTKLDDGAVFCTNCGHKLATEAAVAAAAPVAEAILTAEPVVTPVAEPVQPASQPMYSEPASQSMYSQPASQSMYSQPANQSMYSQPTGQSMYSEPASQSMYSQPNNSMAGAASAGAAYGASQGTYGNNTYGAQNMDASYNYSATQQPQKKKGKGCLIALFIGLGVLVLGIIVTIVAIIAGVAMFGNDDEYTYNDDYSYDYEYEYSYDSDDDSEVPEELDDMMDEATSYDYETATEYYDVEDIYGYWEGSSTLVSVSGAAEMQEYLEDLIGRPLTDDEIAGLYGESAEEAYFWMDIFEYEGWDGFWDMDLDMGDYFLVEPFDTYDAVTYDQFADDDFSTAVIDLDSNNCFEIEVMERDYIGEYGCQFFDAYDYDVQESEVEEDGAYGIVINGQVVEGSDGPMIQGQIVIMFQYGDMSEPYGMAYEYTLTDCYEY